MWVRQHFEHETEDLLLSPSAPPSQLDDSDAPSYGPSDSEESSHSLPPRMALRWNDGRPDIPIVPNEPRSHSRSHSRSRSHRSVPPGSAPHPLSSAHGSVSRNPSGTAVPPTYPRYEQTLSYVTMPGQEIHVEAHSSPPASPEHIVVLPSPQEEDVPQAPINMSASSSHYASHHEPAAHSRTPTARSAHPAPPNEPLFDTGGEHLPQPDQSIISPTPRHAYNPSHVSRHTARSPPIAHSQSQPLPAQHTDMRYYGDPAAASYRTKSQLPYVYSPPAIVYAPSAKHGGSRYAPPAIVYSPPSHSRSHLRGPAPSITYSQSAPLPHSHNPYYSRDGSQGVPQRPSYRGVPSQLSSATVEEEAEYEDVPSRDRTQRRSARRSHHRQPSTPERSRGRSPGVIPVPRSPSRSQSRPETPGLSEAGSQASGSTYYILPTPGQKVQIIVSIIIN